MGRAHKAGRIAKRQGQLKKDARQMFISAAALIVLATLCLIVLPPIMEDWRRPHRWVIAVLSFAIMSAILAIMGVRTIGKAKKIDEKEYDK